MFSLEGYFSLYPPSIDHLLPAPRNMSPNPPAAVPTGNGRERRIFFSRHASTVRFRGCRLARRVGRSAKPQPTNLLSLLEIGSNGFRFCVCVFFFYYSVTQRSIAYGIEAANGAEESKKRTFLHFLSFFSALPFGSVVGSSLDFRFWVPVRPTEMVDGWRRTTSSAQALKLRQTRAF